jgi:ribonuclease BN (tRNA processing enzyme)
LDGEDTSIVFSTDTEHPIDGIDENLAHLAKGADALIYDATFTPKEYDEGKRGWGHSTWLEGTKLAEEAQVKHLYLSHFSPNHGDALIDKSLLLAKEKFPNTSVAQEET